MSLATRCTQCGTAFRVVQDQLKVSEGWVRCGRCSEVFNALEGLFDLDREGPISGSMSLRPALEPEGTPAASDPAPAGMSAAPTRPGNARIDATFETDVAHAEQVGYGFGASDFDNADTQFETRASAESSLPMAFAQDSRPDDDLLYEDEGPPWSSSGDLAAPDARAGGAVVSRPVPDMPDAPAVDAAPAFLRQAEQAALWQRPRMRLALAVAALLLSLSLFAQWMLHHRDALVASWPELAAPMAALCGVMGCQVDPLRRIEALAVESSGLTRLEGSTLYRLQVSVRNRDTVPVMTPALDLALTDTRSDVVARRVLAATELAAAVPGLPARLAPGAELQLAAVLDLGERRVAGYTVELFYP